MKDIKKITIEYNDGHIENFDNVIGINIWLVEDIRDYAEENKLDFDEETIKAISERMAIAIDKGYVSDFESFCEVIKDVIFELEDEGKIHYNNKNDEE